MNRFVKLSLFMIAILLIGFMVLIAAPSVIKPETARTLNQTITTWWGISSIIQYLLYVGISFYLVPLMARKKLQELTSYQSELNTFDTADLNHEELVQYKKAWNLNKQKLKRVEGVLAPKTAWTIFIVLCLFDLIAGQLPFILMKLGG